MPPSSQSADAQITSQRRGKIWILVVTVVVAAALAAAGAWYLLRTPNRTDTIDTNSISISSDGFTPSTIRIKKGDQVTWTNTDNKQRGIIADQQDISGLTTDEPLRTGDTFTYTFEKPGTYTYRDSAFPDTVQGIVIVE